MNIHSLRPRDHEDAARVAISWLSDLTPGQRDWIAQLRARPLCLYRVTDVRPGEGMTLIDEFNPQAEPQRVREISGSRSARPGMLMGARIMQVGAVGATGDGHRELSGAGDAARARQAAASAGSSGSGGPGLPPAVMAQALEQVLHRHYANWSDEAILALGGLTPRQAITTPAGLERVKGLLREYGDGEQQQSAAQGRPTVSYQFLWDALGISR